MQKKQNLSDVVVEVSERGFEQVRVYADSSEQRDRALALLLRVSPQLRALERALKNEVENR